MYCKLFSGNTCSFIYSFIYYFFASSDICFMMPAMPVCYARFFGYWKPEIHANRQVTQHGCLPNLLGEGDKGIYIVYGEEKYILYFAD
jgi:hypothetical protein